MGASPARRFTRRDFLGTLGSVTTLALAAACAPSPPPSKPAETKPAAPAATTAPAAAPAAAAPTAAAVQKPQAQAPAAPAATTAPAAAPAAAARKPIGTLTVGIKEMGNPGYIPSRMDAPAGNIVHASFGEPLIERKADRSLAPRLAKQWSVSPDGLVYTFDLRNDVKWHDGQPFTSEDVKYTLEQVGKEGSTNSRAAQWRSILDKVETPSPDKAIVRLKKVDISAIYGLAAPGVATQAMFSSKYISGAGDDAAAQKPVGTGPWKFSELRPAESVKFTAVENHWRQTPAFADLVIRQIPEDATRIAAVQRGEIDLAQVPLSSAKQLQEAGASLFIQPNAYALFISLQGQYLPSRGDKFKKDVPWAADPADAAGWEKARKVREALNVAIDRQAIVDTILAKQAIPTAYPYAVPGSVFDDPGFKPPAYDPAKAKQLLAEAGYANGFDMPLLLAEAGGRPLAPEVGQSVAQFWQAIGVRVRQSKVDFTAQVRAGTIDRTLAGQAFTFGLYTYDEPFVGHVGNFGSEAETQFGAEYKPLDDLIAKAASTNDPDARQKIQIEMGKMVVEQNFMISIAWVHALVAGGKRVKSLPQIAGVTQLHNLEYAEPGA
jgi:peptide/nickel transport system substrate-binding protein